MPLLELLGLRKSFGGLRVLDEVNLAVGPGETVGLIGPNGAGKTTVFNIVSGFLRPDAGQVRLDGRDLVGRAPHRICHLGIGRTFQVVQPFNELTALDNVVAGAVFGGRDGARSMADLRAEAASLLELVRLGGRGERLAGSLALSERKRLELARALATRPRLLLLDEVMAGLNPAELEEMGGVILAIREARGLTILFIEHNVRFVVGLSDRVAVLNRGRIIAEGRPQDVVREPEVVKAYLGERKDAGRPGA